MVCNACCQCASDAPRGKSGMSQKHGTWVAGLQVQGCTLLSSSYLCCRSCRFSMSNSCTRCWALSSCSLYLSSSLSLSLHRNFQRVGGRSICLPSLLHLPVLKV